MEYLVRFFAWIMDLCYQVVPNHWADILIFTLVTKVLQYPQSIWCHVNSLKMVSIMPQSIRIKIDHFGDSEKIGEETSALFKREHYHPMLSLIPLAIQIVILMGFVKVILSPMRELSDGTWVPDFESRYFTEDIEGTCAIQSFARRFGVSTPIIDELVDRMGKCTNKT